MENKKINWTDDQRAVIEHEGKNILVSASAGSGKTTVMIEKIVRLITQKHIPVSSFLVVTFTKTSAADMKKKLIDKLLEKDSDEFLLEQISAVETSDISTLHVFCSRLIQTYFYEIDIDPNFSVIDETQSNLFKERAITKVFENQEKQESEDYFTLIEIFKKNRDDTGLKNAVFALSTFLKSIINSDEWFKKTIEESHDTDFENSECVKIINNSVCARIGGIIEEFEQFMARCLEIGEQVAYDWLVDVESMLKSISFANSYIVNAKNLFNISIPIIPKIAAEHSELKNDFSEFIKATKKTITELCSNMISTDEHQLKLGIVTAKKHLEMLYALTKSFDEQYAKLKRDAGLMDFNDLEVNALKILENSAIRDAVKEKYKYVFVDEYQDINAVQEEIISRVSSKKNRFMVGDIKQSIYAFRLCDPAIFLDTLKRYSAAGDDSEVIKLNANFRSDKKILKFVDRVFSGVMTEKFGGTDYQKDAVFVAGENNLDNEKSVNLCLIDSPKEKREKVAASGVYSVKNHEQEDEEDTTKIIAEANLVAGKISELTDVTKPDAIKRSDIAILVSARKNPKIQKFVDVLESFGIAVSSGEKQDIIKEPYVQEVLNFITLAVNKNDDITLFKVLKSKMFNFSNNELCEIRRINFKNRFFECVYDGVITENSALDEKLKHFNAQLNHYTNLAKMLNVKDFAKLVIEDFKLEELDLLEKNGVSNVKNLKLFVDALPDCSAVEFVLNYPNYSQDVESELSGDTVKLMTIHASKGIEFKVVFLVDVNHLIQLKDTYKSFLLNKDIGIALDYFDFDTRTKQTTIPISAVRILEQRKIVEEQQRVLYVALTRAIEKLYIVCSKDKEKIREKFPARPKAFVDWFERIMFDELEGRHDEKINFELYDIGDLLKTVVPEKKQLLLAKEGDVTKSFEYKFTPATHIPLKSSVSNLIKSEFDDENDVYETNIISEEKIASSAKRGTLYHKIFSQIDLKNKNFDVQVEKIVSKLLDDEKSIVDKSLILSCLKNEFFANISDNDIVLKEREFVAKVDANDEFDDKFILQGVADLIVIRKNEMFLLDYKTGKINENKLKRYNYQLNLYAEVLERAYKIPVTKKILAFIDEEKFIEIWK